MGVEVERRGPRVTIVASGDYPAEALMRALDTVVAQPDLPPDAQLVVDLRRSDSLLRRSRADLRAVTTHFQRHAPRFGRRVALVSDGPVRYGLLRMTVAWAALFGTDARVFPTRDAAGRWLDAETPHRPSPAA